MSKTPLERFNAKLSPPNDGECIEWTGSQYSSGYGSFYFRGRVQAAHRVAWLLFKNEIPDGLWVLHKCDNPLCVNVDHLFLGTRRDNVADMDRKGRRANTKGERHAKAKLTEADVLLIRSLRGKVSQRDLGRRFGVTKTTIGLAQNGTHWSHVAEGIVRQMPAGA